jgi:hypothetical protein
MRAVTWLNLALTLRSGNDASGRIGRNRWTRFKKQTARATVSPLPDAMRRVLTTAHGVDQGLETSEIGDSIGSDVALHCGNDLNTSKYSRSWVP